MLNLATSTNLEGFDGSNGYFRDQTGTVTGVQDLGIGAGVPVTYDASTHTFGFVNFAYLLPKSVNLTGTQLSYNSTLSDNTYSVYTAQTSGASLSFRQLTPGTANATLPLVYTSLAVAKAVYVDPSTGVTDYGVTPMTFGLLFNWDTTKLTGSGNYSGIVIGQARGQNSTHAYDISGTVGISINYDTTAFTGQLHLIATDDVSGKTFDLGTFKLSQVSPRGVLDYFYAQITGGDMLQGRLGGPMGEEFVAGIDAHVADPQAPSVVMKISAALAAKK